MKHFPRTPHKTNHAILIKPLRHDCASATASTTQESAWQNKENTIINGFIKTVGSASTPGGLVPVYSFIQFFSMDGFVYFGSDCNCSEKNGNDAKTT